VLRPLISLRQRNFRLYWSGQVISLVGGRMQTIGQAWLVLQLTHNAWQLGVVATLQSLPMLFLSLLGGIIADRWPKRRILLITETGSMLQALLLWALVATGSVRLGQIYVLAVLLGLLNSLELPTSRAFIVEMVGRDDLSNAIALYSSVTTLARVVGPGLAGVIIAAGGVSTLFLLNVLTFLPAVAGLALMRSRDLHGQAHLTAAEQRPLSTWQRLREGLEFVWRMPAVAVVVGVVGLVLLFGSNFNVVLPLFATATLHAGPTGFGFLSAATGIGALLAALWLAWANRQPTIGGILLGMAIFGVLEAVFALVHVYGLSLALIAAVAFAENAFAAQSLTALQALTPDQLRGRVVSVQVLFFDGSLPLGSLLMGWLSSSYGAPRALLVGALLSLLVVAFACLWRKPAERNAVELARLHTA
jgi:MFS family permease